MRGRRIAIFERISGIRFCGSVRRGVNLLLMSKVSLSDFARHVGISRTTARDLELQSIIDRTKGMDACRLGYIAHLCARRSNDSAAADALRAARAREIEVRTAEREHKLVPLEELNFAWDFCLGTLVSNLSSVPARCTRDLVLRQTIEREIDLARNATADVYAKQAESLAKNGKAEPMR
jgi:phage terminase Nu1 subunit (DNA packaging protein)